MSLEITPPAETPEENVPAFVVANKDGSVSVDPTLVPETASETPKERPAGLPEGFDSWESLAAKYAELTQAPEPAKPVPAENLQITSPENAVEAAKAAGVDLGAMSKEFAEKGELSAESLKLLADKGISKQTVDTYIEGQKAQAQLLRTQIAESVGGEENLTALLAWAGTGLTAAEQASYNKILAAGDVEITKVALAGLQAKQEAALGRDGRRLDGGTGKTAGSIAPFASQEEAVAAMADKRYNVDSAYRAKIAARLAISDVFHIAYS